MSLREERLFLKAVKEVLPVDRVVRENCYGCVHYKCSQKDHDVCLTSVGERIYSIVDEALETVSRRAVMDKVIELCDDDPLIVADVFKVVFRAQDPLQRVRHDNWWKLHLVSDLLGKPMPDSVDCASMKIYELCHQEAPEESMENYWN